jgi:HAD superfamily phosphatase
MGWSSYFPIVLGKEKQGDRTKPDPFPLNHTLTMLAAVGRDVDASEAAYVGDSVDDMKAARAANMWAIGVVPPYLNANEHASVLDDAGAHTVLDTPNDLPAVLRRFDEQVASTRNA